MTREFGRRRSWQSENLTSGRLARRKAPAATARFVVIGLSLAIVGTIVGLFWYLRPMPSPLGLAIAITQYTDQRLPPNPWALADAEAINGHFDTDSALALQGQEKQALKDLVAALVQRMNRPEERGRPIVLYLNSLAAVHHNKVYILPGRAEPNNPQTWLPLHEILEEFAKGRTPRLLILDIARPLIDARLGLLENPVASVLHTELTDAERSGRLPFLVLTSCGPDEVAWPTPELRRSVFGFFVEQALRGHADGWADDGSTDGRVSARELIEFVRIQVPHWADATRSPAQNPQVYGKGDDFVLLSPPQPFEPLTLPEPMGEYPKWLAEGWAELDRWEADGSFRLVPRTYLELQDLLKRVQNRWLAGDSEDILKSLLNSRLEDLQRIRREAQLQPMPSFSLARSKRKNGLAHPTIAATIRALRDRFLANPQPWKPEELKPLADLFAKPAEAADKTSASPPYDYLAQTVLDALIELPDPSRDLIKAFDGLIRSFPPAGEYVEMACLRFLAEVEPRIHDRWSDRALAGVRQTILRIARSSESAVAVDSRLIPWIIASWTANEADYREAIRLVTVGGEQERIDGHQRLQTCLKRWEQLFVQAQTLEAAWQSLDETRVILLPLAETLSVGTNNPVDEHLWRNLIANYETLQALLNPNNPPKEIPLDRISSAADQLRFEVSRVKKRFGMDECERWIRSAGSEGGPSSRDLWQALSLPQWSWPVRQRLYHAARDSAHAASVEAFAKVQSVRPRTTIPNRGARWLQRPEWRGRLALDILRLDPSPEFAHLEETLKTKRFNELGDSICREWTVLLPERFRKAPDLWNQERSGIITHPSDVSVIPERPGQLPWEPTPQRLRQLSAQMSRWLAEERCHKTAALYRATDNAALKNWAGTLESLRQQLLAYTP